MGRHRWPPEVRARLGVDDGPLDTEELREVAEFLRTGDHDGSFASWRGQSILAKCIRGTQSLEDALVAEVQRRSEVVGGHDESVDHREGRGEG